MTKKLLAATRTIVLVPIFFGYTMFLAIIVIAYGAMRPGSMVLDNIVRHWSSVFLRLPPVDWNVEGLEHVDPSQRYIVTSNHLSMFDIPLVFRGLPMVGRFLAKKELYRIPLFGPGMRTFGTIEIDRSASGSTRQAITDGVNQAAERGYSLIVFPEGTRSTTGELLPFKKGAFRIAIDTGLPVLPVIIEGTDRISVPGSKMIYPGKATLRVLQPIDTSEMTNKDDLNRLTADVEKMINENYDDMRAQAGDTR